mmetsp:Transcript_53595/g.106686  ORF Transcript_53595/g.106686 Transcript_53595/m.106686 type:complete len:268 (-) Transcript_53595:1920-2723(-)
MTTAHTHSSLVRTWLLASPEKAVVVVQDNAPPHRSFVVAGVAALGFLPHTFDPLKAHHRPSILLHPPFFQSSFPPNGDCPHCLQYWFTQALLKIFVLQKSKKPGIRMTDTDFVRKGPPFFLQSSCLSRRECMPLANFLEPCNIRALFGINVGSPIPLPLHQQLLQPLSHLCQFCKFFRTDNTIEVKLCQTVQENGIGLLQPLFFRTDVQASCWRSLATRVALHKGTQPIHWTSPRRCLLRHLLAFSLQCPLLQSMSNPWHRHPEPRV